MNTSTLTPQQRKKKLSQLKFLHSSIRTAFSFNQITTWNEMLKRIGEQPLIIDKPITFNELKQHLTSRELMFEAGACDESNQHKHEHPKPTQPPKIEAPIQQTNPNIATKTQSLIPLLLADLQRWDNNFEEAIYRQALTNNSLAITETVVDALPIGLKNITVPDPVFDASNNYGLIESPNANPKLIRRWYQKKATAELHHKIVVKGYTGVLLIAATGSGKTFIIADLVRMIEDIKWYESRTDSPIPVLYVTKATIIEQTERVFEKYFNLTSMVDIEIINIEQLRSTAGKMWIKEEKYIDKGVEKWRYVWKPKRNPGILLIDESQGTKNRTSTQSQIIYAYNDIPKENRCLVSISATPFVRVCEAQAWAVSTNALIDHHPGFPEGTRLTNETWKDYSEFIAHPSKPIDYCQEAVARLVEDLEEYIVRVKGIRAQFEPINRVKIIQFESPEKREYYRVAWERFLAEKAKLDAAKESGELIGACQLVVLLKYSMAAEFCHAEGFADHMHQSWQSGKAGVCFVKFKQTLIEVVEILINKYGYKRDDISLIWGGGQTQLTDKQKKKAKIRSLKEKLASLGITEDEFISDAGLDDVEDRVIKDYPAWLKLGLQSKKERQSEIDKFQSGKTKFCIYTLKSGGVGLSLPHTDEWCSQYNDTVAGFEKWYAEKIFTIPPDKRPDIGHIRYKNSGYAFEEDIKYVFTRPRRVCGCVTYNAIELVQGVGRAPRINSLSVTEQDILCYAGTIEVKMGAVYSMKLRCLTQVVKQKEDWNSIIFGGGGYESDNEVKKMIEVSSTYKDDESGIVNDNDESEDE